LTEKEIILYREQIKEFHKKHHWFRELTLSKQIQLIILKCVKQYFF